MPWYNKYYKCSECGELWKDEWYCLCNDRCPTCDTECEPYDHAKIDEGSLDTGTGPSFITIIPRRFFDESPET